MSASRPALLAALLAIFAGRAAAQTPASGQPDPGVQPVRLIDRAEVRATRVELQPGAVRSVHAHDDVEYHLWIPLEGTLEITIEPDGPRIATPGEAIYMLRGTRHGFRNVGSTPAAVLEVFVKRSEP
jgi:quercetin dioxygenase-like cupin family protein